MDIADAHVCALERFRKNVFVLETYNLGSGRGSTVLEVIKSFEKVSGKKCDYTIVERRVGDADKIYADTTLANNLLHWRPKYSLDEMILSYWKYYSKITTWLLLVLTAILLFLRTLTEVKSLIVFVLPV